MLPSRGFFARVDFGFCLVSRSSALLRFASSKYCATGRLKVVPMPPPSRVTWSLNNKWSWAGTKNDFFMPFGFHLKNPPLKQVSSQICNLLQIWCLPPRNVKSRRRFPSLRLLAAPKRILYTSSISNLLHRHTFIKRARGSQLKN